MLYQQDNPNMTLTFSKRMAEATRLTKSGRLQEALDMLQGAEAGGVTDSSKPAGGQVLRTGVLSGLGAVLRRVMDQSVRPLDEPAAGNPTAKRFERYSFSNEAGARDYRLYEPSRADTDSGPLPLIVMLHGCSQSPEDFAAGTQMNALAEEFGFYVVYPGQTTAANAARCWNWFQSGEQERGRGEPSLIAGITREVIRDRAVDPMRVYVAGLSAGGAAAAIMGQAYPDIYAAIGVHSGLACGAAKSMGEAFGAMSRGGTPPAKTKTRAVPAIVFHGDRDSTVHHDNGNHVIAQAKAAGALDSSVEQGRSPGGVDFTRTIQSDGSGCAVLEQWVLHGSGHAWSGGNAAGSFTDPRGPDASREMVRFFLSHRRGD
jgi:poly(hydroxyalkanoate) depolymerase family esterase